MKFIVRSLCFLLLVSMAAAAPPSVGDFVFSYFDADGYHLVSLTPGSGKSIGFDNNNHLQLQTPFSGVFTDLTGKPTTLSGYGITDPVVLTSSNYVNPSFINSIVWSKITSTPSTLNGYGITDAVPSTRMVNGHDLGSNVTITASDLGLVIGVNTQAWNTKLDAFAALANGAGWLHNNGSGTFAYSTPTKSDVGLGNVPNTDATNAGNISIGTLSASRLPALSGDITSSAGSASTTLASSGVSAGSYTSANITVDAKGRVTAASNGSGGGGATITTPHVLYATTSGNDSTGDGSLGKPFRTAQKCYDTGIVAGVPFAIVLGIGDFTGSNGINTSASNVSALCAGITGRGIDATSLEINSSPPDATNGIASSSGDIIVRADALLLNAFAVGGNVNETDGGAYNAHAGANIVVRGTCMVNLVSVAGGSGTITTGTVSGGDAGTVTLLGVNVKPGSGTITLSGGVGQGANSGADGSMTADGVSFGDVVLGDVIINGGTSATLRRTSRSSSVSFPSVTDGGGNATW